MEGRVDFLPVIPKGKSKMEGKAWLHIGKLSGHIFNQQHEAGRANWNQSKALKDQGPSLNGIPLPAN